MKRIAIVGCPGVGKTTFTRKLAHITGVKKVHLDVYYHDKKHDYPHDRGAWVSKVEELVRPDKWIMDGNYSSSFDARFARADTIIFMDYPRRFAMFGILKRRIRYQGKKRDDMPSDWEEKTEWKFIKYVWRFQGRSRDTILEYLDKYSSKDIVTFKNRQEADDYLAKLKRQ